MPIPFQVDDSQDYFNYKGRGGPLGPASPGAIGSFGGFGGGGGAASAYPGAPASAIYGRRFQPGVTQAAPPGGAYSTSVGSQPQAASANAGAPNVDLFNIQQLRNLGRGAATGAPGTASWTVNGQTYHTPTFDPNDPFGRLYGGWDGNVNQLLNYLLNQGGAAGTFGPQGSQGILDQLTRVYQQQGIDAQRKAQLQGRLDAPGDPALAAYGAMMGGLNADQAQSQGLAQAQLQQMTGAQDWYRQLLNSLLQYQQTRDLGQQGYDFSNALQNQMRPNVWGQLGGIVGQGIGGYFGSRGH